MVHSRRYDAIASVASLVRSEATKGIQRLPRATRGCTRVGCMLGEKGQIVSAV